MIAYIDPQVQQPEVAIIAVVEVHRGVDLVVVGHHVDAIAFLISDQRIERDVVRCFYGTQGIISREGGAGFKGKAAGGPDRGEICLEGSIGVLFFATAAFAGVGQAHNRDQKSTDEHLAHQFPPFYSSRCKHLRTNIV